jgi:hypothetical protein
LAVKRGPGGQATLFSSFGDSTRREDRDSKRREEHAHASRFGQGAHILRVAGGDPRLVVPRADAQLADGRAHFVREAGRTQVPHALLRAVACAPPRRRPAMRRIPGGKVRWGMAGRRGGRGGAGAARCSRRAQRGRSLNPKPGFRAPNPKLLHKDGKGLGTKPKAASQRCATLGERVRGG